MSNAALLSQIHADIDSARARLARLEPWVDIDAARQLKSARDGLSTASFHLAIAARIGVDPVVEATARRVPEPA